MMFDSLMEISNWELLIPLIILDLILKIIALVDFLRYRKIREIPFVWLFVILLINIFGPVIYFIIGRRDT